MEEHGKHRPLVGAAFAAFAALWGGAGAAAECRLALLLAIDVSSSVDPAEDALQRQGIAAALVSTEVSRAALALPGQPVALAAFEWSGRFQQDAILDWSLIETHDDLAAAAARIGGARRVEAAFPTAMGYAIGHAAQRLAEAPDCMFRTLDISGDGVNNDGFGPGLAYRHFPFDDITVNGLAILGEDEGEAVARFYREEVVHGPGAFVEIADGFGDIARAMRRKLERELAPRVVGGLR